MALKSYKLFHLTQNKLGFRFLRDASKYASSSYTFMPGDVTLSCATLGQMLDEAADKNGNDIYCISAHQEISKTYSQFQKEANKLASGLISLGLKKGDRVAIWAPNCIEWPVAQFATAKAGLILVNINPAFQSQELEYCLKKVRCKALVMWDQLKTQNFYEILCKIAPELPKSPPGMLKSQNLPDLTSVVMISEKAKEGTLTFNDVQNNGNAESNEAFGKIERAVQFDDPVNIQFTSGTTGNPKGSLLSHHNIINNSRIVGRRVGYHLNRPIVCCAVPLFHCFGCVSGTLASLVYKGSIVFPSKIFNSKESLAAIEKYKCTIIYGTPTMNMDLLQNYRLLKSDVSSLKQIIIGGAASPEALVENLKKEMNLDMISIAYGCTETSPAVAVSDLNEYDKAVKGVLKPVEFLEFKIIDDKGQVVPKSHQGELCVRGHAVFLGYFEEKAKNKEVLEPTNWYRTGDLATMNDDGYIQIVGRKKDMVIRGGENLFPAEIENFLHKHPAILEAQVVGVPDEKMGEELCAWICLRFGQQLTEQELRDYCKGKISHFKVPKYIIFVESFPKTETGKVKKFEIRRISKEKLNLK